MISTVYLASGWLDLNGSLALQLVAFVSLVLVLVLSASKVYDRFWPKPSERVPQPFAVKTHDELATRTELMAVEKRIEGDIQEIRHQIEVDRKESRDGQDKIHSRIDEAVGKVDHISGQLVGVASNLDRLLSLALGNQKK